MGNPFLYTRHDFGRRNETGTDCLSGMLQQIEQDVFLFSVGYDDGNTFVGHLPGNGSLGKHASSAETGLLGLDIVGQIFSVFHLTYHRRTRLRRRTVVNAVDVTQDNQSLNIEHRSNHTRQFVIVSKHQFGNGYGIVFVYDRDDSGFQHHPHTVTLVQIMTAGSKTFLGCQHLPYGNAVFAKQFIVPVNQLCLSHSRIQLTLCHAVEFPRHLDLAASRSDRSRRNQYHLHSCLVQLGYLVNQGRHTSYVQRPVTTGKYIASYLYRYLCKLKCHNNCSFFSYGKYNFLLRKASEQHE